MKITNYKIGWKEIRQNNRRTRIIFGLAIIGFVSFVVIMAILILIYLI